MTHSLKQHIKDPRQYPQTTHGNELLRHTFMQLHAKTPEDEQIHHKALKEAIENQLQENQILPISVALSMVTSQKTYQTIWQSLDHVLQTQSAGHFIVIPTILIVGTEQNASLPEQLPKEILNQVLDYKNQEITWCDTWVDAETLSTTKANQWRSACQDVQSADQTLKMLQSEHISFSKGQDVRLIFAVGFQHGQLTEQKTLSPETPFLLMQALTKHFSQTGLTLFINPLKPQSILNGLVEGGAMQLTMALDVFASTAIRTIRLQQETVGVVIASQEPGKLMFSFSSIEQNVRLPVQGFTWELSPLDDIDTIIGNFLSLLSDCQIEQVLLCKNVMSENEHYLSYKQAALMEAINPLSMQPLKM